MANIHLEVQCYAGSNVHEAIRDMVALANRVNADVWCTLNDVRTLARPGDTPSAVSEAWKAELSSNRQYKYASQDRRP